MSEQEHIDWSKSTFDGSRREQLKRWRALSLRERLEALDRLTAHAERTRQAASWVPGQEVREPHPSYSSGRRREEIVLYGCTPTPLASYLKALAVLRLVAEQAGDPDATGFWRNDVFVLRTTLTKADLCDYFLFRYKPMVILSPWNGRAGFLEGDEAEESTRKGPQILSQLCAGKGDRLAGYRRLVEQARSLREIVEFNDARAQLKEIERRKKRGEAIDEEERKRLTARSKELKTILLVALRSQMPDPFLDWMDACLVIGSDKPLPAPLLGSGGNEGSMDFSINHVALLMRLIDPDTDAPSAEAAGLLKQALFEAPATLWSDVNLGQLSPGSVGGPNMSAGFSGPLLENPWSAVLALEGSISFSGSASKRLDSTADPALSFPFLVGAVQAGAGSIAWGERAKPEIWLPIWDTPATYEDIHALIREGRLTLGRRQAESALDAARAVAGLGIDRGITAFERFGIYERRGDGYYVVTPVGRFAVPAVRNRAVDLLSDLNRHGWLKQLHSVAAAKEVSTPLRAAAERLDTALFALTQNPGRTIVQKVLCEIGRIEALCATSPKTREAIRFPVPTLSSEWVRRADDGSSEFRIALALAGLSLPFEQDGKQRYMAMRPHLAPLTPDGKSWDKDSHLICWGAGPLTRNLAAVLHRRRLEAVRLNAEGELLRSRTGATLADVRLFLDGETDDRRIAELLAGLACTDLSQLALPEALLEVVPPLPAYALLKPFFTSESLLRAIKIDGREGLPPDCNLRLPAEIPARLASGDISNALENAWQRLRALGAKLPGRKPPRVAGVDGPRLLAALMIPLTFAETARLLRWLDRAPEFESLEEFVEHTA
jgi:CRISPR-associated protein Csx17